MVEHDAHVREWQELCEIHHIGWYDATIEAGHWFALAAVEPSEAAMLLCQFNPNADSLASAEQSENEETSPEQLKRLRRRFEDLQNTVPLCRSLAAWLEFAIGANLKHHSWARRYRDALQAGARSTTPAPVVPVPATPGSASSGVKPPPLRKPNGNEAAGPVFSMTRSALTSKHRRDWVTIERDLKDAASNGLSVAKAGNRDWKEDVALDWARAKGKLKSTETLACPLEQAMHNMSSLPVRKHALQR